MSIRNNNLGSIVKPGFNALGAQTSVTTYEPYLYSWGSGGNGRLGLGNTTSYSSPKQVGSLTTWANISTGQSFTIATKNDGTLWSWGFNFYGQLGLNNATSYSSPKQIGALTSWSVISAGDGNFSVAIKTDGTLWTWGLNTNGQLGLGNTTSYSSPKQVGALTTWSSISAGQRFSIATKIDGTLWSWGYNFSGQLGLGNTTYYSSPKQVGALTTWSRVAAGWNFSSAIAINGWRNKVWKLPVII